MRNYFKPVVLLVSCFIFSASMNAEETPCQNDLSISELVDIALQNNPETRTAWWNARRASLALKATSSNDYPELYFHGNVSHGRDYKFINSRETSYTSFGTDLVLAYILYDSGENRANIEAAQAALCAANWQTDWTLQKVMSQVIQNTYTYLNAQELLSSRLESLNDTTNTLEAAQDLNRVGLRSVNDVYTLQATIAEMKIAISLQKAELDIAQGKLAASLGYPVDAKLKIAPLKDPQPDQVMMQNLNCLIDTARQKRNDLMAKHAELAQKVALAKKTKASYLPKVSVNGDGGYTHFWKDHANGLQYNIGLNLDFPVFDGYESIYQTRIAYSNIQITESELQKLELDIALEVLTYSRLFEASQEILQFADDNLQFSIKTFDGILDKYRAGTQSIFELTAAQKQLADARIRHSDAKIRWYKALSQLAYATGTITTSEGKQFCK